MPCHLTKNSRSGRPSKGLGGRASGPAMAGFGAVLAGGGCPHFQINIFCILPLSEGHYKEERRVLISIPKRTTKTQCTVMRVLTVHLGHNHSPLGISGSGGFRQ